MQHHEVPSLHPSSPRAALATRLIFFFTGLGMAAWAPLVPFVKARAGLDESTLGLLLLCLGVGSLAAMPFAGAMARRWGCRRVLLPSALLMAACLPLLAVLASLPSLVVTLLLFGAALGALDCTMNLQAVIVERQQGRPMMSGFHGLFSVGGLAGAGGISLLMQTGLSPLVSVACLLAVMAATLLLAAPQLLPYADQSTGAGFALPRGVVVLIGALCFLVFLTEGAVLDWSAVLLTAVHQVDLGRAGYGYAAFSAAMIIGRLGGDRLVARIGGLRALVVGALLASAGLLLATLAGSSALALAGFFLVGAGCSNIVPVLFSAAGRQTAMSASAAIPAVTAIGYSGILAGPALIGFGAHAAGLQSAFVAVAVSLWMVAAGGLVLRRLRVV
ncbi:MAG: MFS transporter [Polaromonas sp.]|nr:MFS transporter [Polaromonas sp.]